MKKLLCIIMALLLSLSLFACAPEEKPDLGDQNFDIPMDGPVTDIPLT